MGDTDNEVKFMGSLVSQYECLVNDLNKELAQCHSIFQHLSTLPIEDESGEEHELLRAELSKNYHIIDNLKKQLEVMSKSNSVSKALWHSTLKHVEHLEASKYLSKREDQLPFTFLSKWKALHSYATNLEERVEKLTKETNFYRKKILDIRLEEEQMKRQCEMDKAKCVQDAKQVLKGEIEQLKSAAELMRREFEAAVEKRLKNERQAWEYKEAQSLRLVRVQVEDLLLENEALEIRERDLTLQVHNLQLENEHLKHQRLVATSELADASCQLKQLVTTGTTEKTDPTSQVEKISAHTQTQMLGLARDEKLGYEENQRKLQEDKGNLQNKLAETESNATNTNFRLQLRIQQLEALNMTLNAQFKDINEKYEGMRRRRHEEEHHHRSNSKTKRIELWDFNSNQNEKIRAEKISSKMELDQLDMDKRLANDKKKDLHIWRLSLEVGRLNAKNQKLSQLVQEQTTISSKWKSEFKELAKLTLPS